MGMSQEMKDEIRNAVGEAIAGINFTRTYHMPQYGETSKMERGVGSISMNDAGSNVSVLKKLILSAISETKNSESETRNILNTAMEAVNFIQQECVITYCDDRGQSGLSERHKGGKLLKGSDDVVTVKGGDLVKSHQNDDNSFLKANIAMGEYIGLIYDEDEHLFCDGNGEFYKTNMNIRRPDYMLCEVALEQLSSCENINVILSQTNANKTLIRRYELDTKTPVTHVIDFGLTYLEQLAIFIGFILEGLHDRKHEFSKELRVNRLMKYDRGKISGNNFNMIRNLLPNIDTHTEIMNPKSITAKIKSTEDSPKKIHTDKKFFFRDLDSNPNLQRENGAQFSAYGIVLDCYEPTPSGKDYCVAYIDLLSRNLEYVWRSVDEIQVYEIDSFTYSEIQKIFDAVERWQDEEVGKVRREKKKENL